VLIIHYFVNIIHYDTDMRPWLKPLNTGITGDFSNRLAPTTLSFPSGQTYKTNKHDGEKW